MPPKKNKLQEELPSKIIKVKKLDSIKPINEQETIPKDSIIKSTVKIMEPVVEIIDNEVIIPTQPKSIIKVKKNLLKTKTLDKPKDSEKNSNFKVSIIEKDEKDDNNATSKKDDTHDNEHYENIEKDENHDETNKEQDKEQVKEKVKDQKKDKIHNHSKPKTIIASTKDVNTVDMFGEDDLDFRYVMMNYDYTKNVTMPKITKYERALLIGKRAKQIEEGANPNVKYISGQSVVSIAEEELRQRKIPLIIKRPIGNKFEYWKPADMEVNMD
jgi:DNA-directed RNA polymerase I, II, and III subunit RPABC2